MKKFSLIIAMCLWFPIVHGEGYIVGDVKWNSSGKALTEDEVKAKYLIEPKDRRADTFSVSRFGIKIDISTDERVQMKMEDPKNKTCFLPLEVDVYEDLQKKAPNKNLLDKGFANIFNYGMYKENRALIMNRLGLDLIEYLNKNKMKFFKWDKLRFIATSTIDNLQFLHGAGYIHQNLKPENIAYGFEDPKNVNQTENIQVSLSNRIYLMDLSAVMRHQDRNGTSYKQTTASPYTITSKPYCSRTYRKRLTQSRRDDMETLGYLLLMTCGVKVPWDGLKNETEIMKQQNRLCDDLDVVSICRQSEIIDKQIQAAFSTYFFLLKKLFAKEKGFCQEPDYAAFKKCFDKDPKAHYLNVTGKQFDKSISAGVGGLMRRAAGAKLLRTPIPVSKIKN